MRLLVLALLLALAGPAGALTITVTNTNPSGPGSLRQAVIDANNNIANNNVINVPAGMGVLAQNGTLPFIKDIELNCGGGSVITTGGFKASAATPLLKLGSFDGWVHIVGESADTIAWAVFNALREAGIAAFPPSPNDQPAMTRAALDGVLFCAVPDPVNGRIRLVAA